MRSVVTTKVLFILVACMGSAVAAGAAPDGSSAPSDGLSNKRFTFWLGGPAVLDYRPGNSGAFTFGIGVGPTIPKTFSDDTGTTTTTGTFGPMGEAFYYPNRKASGLALNLRVGSANGVYFAPGIFYVSRPKGSICGRFGLMAPLGGGALPVLPELAIGFRF